MSQMQIWRNGTFLPQKKCAMVHIRIWYYLRSKMIVHFLEFEIFWEKFVNTLVDTNCTFTGKCSFHKKEFMKSCEEIGKVNKLFLPFDRKLIYNRIFSCSN